MSGNGKLLFLDFSKSSIVVVSSSSLISRLRFSKKKGKHKTIEQKFLSDLITRNRQMEIIKDVKFKSIHKMVKMIHVSCDMTILCHLTRRKIYVHKFLVTLNL